MEQVKFKLDGIQSMLLTAHRIPVPESCKRAITILITQLWQVYRRF